MNVTTPRASKVLVRQNVEEGRDSTEAEVVADALRLMEARGKAAQINRARLQDMIDPGYEDVAAGKVIRLEHDDQVDASFADLWDADAGWCDDTVPNPVFARLAASEPRR